MSYASPWSFLKVRLPLCCPPPTPSHIAGSLGSRRNVQKNPCMNALPCPQSHLPAAICSALPWFLILPDQICHVASKGNRLQLMPLPLYGQLADLLLHRAVGCFLTEDWAQTSGYAFLSGLSTSKPQEDTACSTWCDASPDLCPGKSSMFKALNRMTN